MKNGYVGYCGRGAGGGGRSLTLGVGEAEGCVCGNFGKWLQFINDPLGDIHKPRGQGGGGGGGSEIFAKNGNVPSHVGGGGAKNFVGYIVTAFSVLVFF